MKKVLVNFIEDRSGSMASTWDETVNGFKMFVEELRDNAEKDGVDYLFSLTTFDTLIETPIMAAPIKDVDATILKKREHGPRGSTALYDAVGVTIDQTDKDRHGAEKIICVIVTDGQENSSREWSKDSLNSAIDARLNAGDWTFVYLGTQPETWDDATKIGIAPMAAAVSPNNRLRYSATADALRSFSSSDEKQVSALFTSKYANASKLRAAGMTTRPATTAGAVDDDPTTTPTPPATPTPRPPASPTTKKWRR